MYLSGYLKQHQAEYYRRLSIIRAEGDRESWVAFFLEGVATAASDAERSIVSVASVISADQRRLLEAPKAGSASYRLFELLPMMPRFTIELGATYGNAQNPGSPASHHPVSSTSLDLRRATPGVGAPNSACRDFPLDQVQRIHKE